MAAIENNKIEAVKCLIDRGADIFVKSKYDYSINALYLASRYGFLEAVILLLEACEKVAKDEKKEGLLAEYINCFGAKDQTPLSAAIEHRHLDVVKKLLSYECTDVNKHQQYFSISPLLLATLKAAEYRNFTTVYRECISLLKARNAEYIAHSCTSLACLPDDLIKDVENGSNWPERRNFLMYVESLIKTPTSLSFENATEGTAKILAHLMDPYQSRQIAEYLGFKISTEQMANRNLNYRSDIELMIELGLYRQPAPSQPQLNYYSSDEYYSEEDENIFN
jgi:hypothetical protein